MELFTQKVVTKLSKYEFGIRDPRSGIRNKPIPDPGSRGQKGTQSRITWKTRGKYSSLKFAGRGDTLGERFGLAHFSNGLWFLGDFSKLT
jgi:hypothetical protein